MSSPKRQYQVHYPKNRAFMLGLGMVQSVITVYMGSSLLSKAIPFSIGALFAATFCGFVALSGFWAAFAMYIITTPEQILYSTMGLRMRTTWANLQQLDSVQALNHTIPILRLAQPATIDAVWTKAGRKAIIQQWSIQSYAYEPGSALGQALQHYAPQLFTKPAASAQ